ncbi:hypothetical protein CLCAR_2510 [Clostridium carboxidivorans P7]|nr:hypothetical protein CLCAR_2510 [Clostridium carboxidivorans P7]
MEKVKKIKKLKNVKLQGEVIKILSVGGVISVLIDKFLTTQ